MAVSRLDADFDEYEKFSEYKRTHDPKLKDELVNAYIYIAEILSRKFINRGLDYEDIYQVACLGIVCAVERFDPDRGIKFATFATPTVMGEIRKYFRDKGNFVKVPRKLYEVFYKAEKIRRSFCDGKISTDEIDRILDIPVSTIEKAYEMGDSSFIMSLEYEAYADGNLNLSNVLGKEDNRFIMIEDRDFLNYCLSRLNDKEKEFIRMRYYDELSQSEIASKWNVSQMYVSRFEKNTLKTIRDLYFRD